MICFALAALLSFTNAFTAKTCPSGLIDLGARATITASPSSYRGSTSAVIGSIECDVPFQSNCLSITCQTSMDCTLTVDFDFTSSYYVRSVEVLYAGGYFGSASLQMGNSLLSLSTVVSKVDRVFWIYNSVFQQTTTPFPSSVRYLRLTFNTEDSIVSTLFPCVQNSNVNCGSLEKILVCGSSQSPAPTPTLYTASTPKSKATLSPTPQPTGPVVIMVTPTTTTPPSTATATTPQTTTKTTTITSAPQAMLSSSSSSSSSASSSSLSSVSASSGNSQTTLGTTPGVNASPEPSTPPTATATSSSAASLSSNPNALSATLSSSSSSSQQPMNILTSDALPPTDSPSNAVNGTLLIVAVAVPAFCLIAVFALVVVIFCIVRAKRRENNDNHRDASHNPKEMQTARYDHGEPPMTVDSLSSSGAKTMSTTIDAQQQTTSTTTGAAAKTTKSTTHETRYSPLPASAAASDKKKISQEYSSMFPVELRQYDVVPDNNANYMNAFPTDNE